jgi:hypothetical protein
LSTLAVFGFGGHGCPQTLGVMTRCTQIRTAHRKRYRAVSIMMSPIDHSNQNLSGQSFRDADLDGADFSGADLRSADFTGASLVEADFTNALLGIRLIAGALLLGAAMVVSAVAGLATAYFMQVMRERLSSGEWQDLLANGLIITVIAAFVAILVWKGAGEALPSLGVLILVAFLADLAIVMAFGRPHIERAPFLIGLMLLFGLAFVAGILGRIVGGAFGAWAIALISVVGASLLAASGRIGCSPRRSTARRDLEANAQG